MQGFTLFTLASGLNDIFNVQQLFADVTDFLTTWVIPGAAALLIAYFALMKNFSEDEGRASEYGKKIPKVLLWSIIGEVGVKLMNWVATYKK